MHTDIAAIAKLIRADIKTAAAGGLPVFAASVRIARFAGGERLSVEVTDAPIAAVISGAALEAVRGIVASRVKADGVTFVRVALSGELRAAGHHAAELFAAP